VAGSRTRVGVSGGVTVEGCSVSAPGTSSTDCGCSDAAAVNSGGLEATVYRHAAPTAATEATTNSAFEIRPTTLLGRFSITVSPGPRTPAAAETTAARHLEHLARCRCTAARRSLGQRPAATALSVRRSRQSFRIMRPIITPDRMECEQTWRILGETPSSVRASRFRHPSLGGCPPEQNREGRSSETTCPEAAIHAAAQRTIAPASSRPMATALGLPGGSASKRTTLTRSQAADTFTTSRYDARLHDSKTP
jgi:hypothetical protein